MDDRSASLGEGLFGENSLRLPGKNLDYETVGPFIEEEPELPMDVQFGPAAFR